MTSPLNPTAQRMQELLRASGYDYQVIETAQSARTAAEAAQVIGCGVEQIVKSLIFRAKETSRPVLVVASGANRVNEKLIAALLGEAIERATPDFVRQHTGYAIGGVPPLGHPAPLTTFIDEDLLQYPQIWAAAGTPHAVFPLTPADLVKMTGGQIVGVK